MNVLRIGVMTLFLVCFFGISAFASEMTAEDVQLNLDIVWTVIAAFLVFFMQPGFAMV